MHNAFAVVSQIFTGWSVTSTLISPLMILTIASVIALQQLPARLGDRLVVEISNTRLWIQVGVGALLLLAITTLGPTGVAPFIYYRF